MTKQYVVVNADNDVQGIYDSVNEAKSSVDTDHYWLLDNLLMELISVPAGYRIARVDFVNATESLFA